jgi:type II secretory pathway component GspD/PulD (secretin)
MLMKRIISVFVLLLFPALNACGQQVSSDMRTLLSSEGKVLYGDEPNSIVVRDYPDNLDQIGQYLEILDVSPKQVLVEARVVEVVLKNEHSLGVNWSLLAAQGGLKIGGYKLTSDGSSTLDQKIPFIPVYPKPGDSTSGAAIDPFTLAVSTNNIDAVLSAMAIALDTDVLSAPRVATVNNRPADISIIQRYPWAEPQLTTSDSGATTVTWTVNWEDIGIILHVTPVINADGDISLTLHPDISELVDHKTLEVQNGGTTLAYEIPVIDKRTATTKVIVGNGQTLIFGGLIKDRLLKHDYKVPFMGDLPVFGNLFKSSNTYKEKTELLILVSPTIINSEEMTHMAKQLRYGAGGKYVLDKERQEKMLLTMENREIQRKIDLNSKWDALTKKQQELIGQTKELEKTVLSEENNLKKLEEAKEAVIARKKSLTAK